jgi:hypothetical protein
MQTPKKMDDLKDWETGLTAEQRLAALNESKAMRAIRELGNRWLLARDYCGHYEPELHARGGA